jgi:hypothetical protein
LVPHAVPGEAKADLQVHAVRDQIHAIGEDAANALPDGGGLERVTPRDARDRREEAIAIGGHVEHLEREGAVWRGVLEHRRRPVERRRREARPEEAPGRRYEANVLERAPDGVALLRVPVRGVVVEAVDVFDGGEQVIALLLAARHDPQGPVAVQVRAGLLVLDPARDEQHEAHPRILERLF